MNLANKYRPQEFDQVVGQLIPKTVLQKEFETGTLKQAYLFIGHSGCGKSSSAMILANMIKGLTIELDVASHNSAEDMKELVRTIRTKPIGYDKTIVILDEAHMMSTQAANSLLITLEQPPAHVIFILCTTNGDKILDTIKNRCEMLNFLPLDVYDISQQLMNVCDIEQIDYEPMAIESIAKQANGSMRQALSYLDIVANEKVTIKAVSEKIVKSTYDAMFDVLYAWLDNNTEELIESVDKIDEKFVQNFFVFVLNINVYIKTNNIKCTDMPIILEEDMIKFSTKDKELLSKLLPALYELQYKGKNSPIIKEMFIACLMTN